MSWYMIILFIAIYIVIWITTSITLSRLWKNKNSIDDSVLFGMIWPIIIAVAPLIILIFAIMKIVEKFGYKED